MRHKKTKALLAYYGTLLAAANEDADPEDRLLPERTAVDPADCKGLLGDMFILEASDDGPLYRLAGTRLCALLGSELRGHGFGVGFNASETRHAALIGRTTGHDGNGRFLCTMGTDADGRRCVLETLLLPLAHEGRRCARLLGMTVVDEEEDQALPYPVGEQKVVAMRAVDVWGSAPVPRLTSAFPLPSLTLKGRKTAPPRLEVIEGGLGSLGR